MAPDAADTARWAALARRDHELHRHALGGPADGDAADQARVDQPRRPALGRGHVRAGRLLHGLHAVGADQRGGADRDDQHLDQLHPDRDRGRDRLPHGARPAQPHDRRDASEVHHEDGRLLVDRDRQLLDLPDAIARAADTPARPPPALAFDRPATRIRRPPDSHRAHDRRLGLRRRRGNPGRPEGVRELRRARHERDHGDHRPEHRRRHRDPRGATRRWCSPRCAPCSPTSAPTPSRSGCSGPPRSPPRSRARSRSCRRHARRRRPRDGRRVGRARCSSPTRSASLVEQILPRATVLTPNLPEARVLAGAPSARDRAPTAKPRSSLAPCSRWAPASVVLTGGHREQAVDLFLDSTARQRDRGDRGRAPPRRRRARLGLHALRGPRRAARARQRPARRPRASRARAPARRSPAGFGTSAPAPAPSTRSGSRACASAEARRAPPRTRPWLAQSPKARRPGLP